MWCSSPAICLHRAWAMLVLPTPGGPTKSHAEGYGFAANFARIFLGFSSPTNSAVECGLYLSASDCGNAKEGVLMRHPLGLAGHSPVSRLNLHTTTLRGFLLTRRPAHEHTHREHRKVPQQTATHRVGTSGESDRRAELLPAR